MQLYLSLTFRMRINKWKIFTSVFNVICITITVGLAGFWTYKFALNEDLCAVEYKEYYHNEDDVYPSMSMCFRVENVTFQLTDYLISYWILWRNGRDKVYPPSAYTWTPIRVSYSGFWREWFFKCFSLEIPSRYVEAVSVHIDNMVFPHGRRPKHFTFFVTFHYPNQILRQSHVKKHHWHLNRKRYDSDYDMRFDVENVETFKRRRNCTKNWLGYDDEVIEYYLQKTGCRPPYYTEKYNLPLCNTSKQLQEIRSRLSLGVHNDFSPPCKALENINFRSEENDLHGTEWESNGHFWCTMFVPNVRFKEFTQAKAIDWQALIGNVGGYVGVCLGWTLLQIPYVLKGVFEKFKAGMKSTSRPQNRIGTVSTSQHRIVVIYSEN